MFKKILGLLSDAAVYGISSMLARVISFLLLPIFTWYLTPKDYGVMAMLAIVGAVFAPLANLGMTNAIFRRFNTDKSEEARARTLTTGMASIALSSVVVLAVGMLFAEPIAQVVVDDPELVGLVRLSLLTGAITAVGLAPFVVLRARRRVKLAATVNLAKLAISVSVSLFLVVVMEQGVQGVVVGTLVSEVCIASALILFTLREFLSGFDADTWRQMLRYGLPFVPHHLQAAGLEMFGIYVVRQMLGLDEAGLYNVAMRFALPVSFVVNAIQTSWVPYKFHIHAQDPDPQGFFRSVLVYYVAGLSYLWVGVSLWGPDAVRLMTAADFHGAGYLVWATALIPAMQGVFYMSGTGIELSDNTRPLPLTSLAGLITVIATSFALVKLWGPLGAALAAVIAWAVMAVVLYTISQRRFAIAYDWPTLACMAVTAAAFVALGGLAQGLPLVARLLTIVAMSAAYPLLMFLLLLRSRDERGRMRHLLTKFRLVPAGR